MTDIKKYFSDLAKKRHKEKPMPREHYQMMAKKSAEAKRKKKHDQS